MDFNEPNTKNIKPFLQNPPILDLPLHILSIIISFLPTKSIICCKLVCKLWCSVIKSPHFNLPSDRVTLLVRRESQDGVSLRNKDLYLVEPEVDFVMIRFRCEIYDVSQCLGKLAVTRFNGCDFDGVPVKLLEVVNSCNGLVCLAPKASKKQLRLPNNKLAIGSGPFFVCNPVTSDYAAVGQSIGFDELCLMEHCGFGYSAQSNQFKVLRLKRSRLDSELLKAEIYILGCDEGWRSIENPPKNYYWRKDRLFFQGSLHWIVSRGNEWEYIDFTIVAFEFQEEKFFLISPPTLSSDSLDSKKMHLAILHQRLCLADWGVDERMNCGQCDIWVMSDYGVKESWRKLYVVEDRENALPDSVFLPSKPLAFLSTGELLLLNHVGELISYDVRSRKMTVVEIPGCTSIEAMLFNPNFAPTRNLITPLKV